MIVHDMIDTRMTECGGSLLYSFNVCGQSMSDYYLEGWKSYGMKVPKAGEPIVVYLVEKSRYMLCILYEENEKSFWLDSRGVKHTPNNYDLWILNPQGGK
jgi:hypothetical protein